VHTTSEGCNFLRVQLGPRYNLFYGNLSWLHLFLGTTWAPAGCNLSQKSCYHPVTKCYHHVTISSICCHHVIIMLLSVTYRDYTIKYTICLGLGLKVVTTLSCTLERLQPSNVVPLAKLQPPRSCTLRKLQPRKVATSCEVATTATRSCIGCNLKLSSATQSCTPQLRVVPHKVYVKTNNT